MALILVVIMVLALLPLSLITFNTPEVSHGEGDSYSYTYNEFYGDGNTCSVSSDETYISGIDNAYIDAPGANITVEGDYYEQGWQFTPKVAEMWTWNNIKGNNALWNPTTDEINRFVKVSTMREGGYAMLYDGWVDLENSGPYKPFGATRVGEVLGYDIYAPEGESFDTQGQMVDGTEYLEAGDSVTGGWAIMHTYRAVGVEYQRAYTHAYKQMPQKDASDDREIIRKLTGKYFDLSASPLSTMLTGNIGTDTEWIEHPVVGVALTRTYMQDYIDRASSDMINTTIMSSQMTSGNISYIQFYELVAGLMQTYGEPVITDTEKYMLLEAYGRDLPYDLYDSQREAVEYLLCRGIITDLQTNWYADVPFEHACEVLMRVKDKGSRETFKEFQLTTDLELLAKGYYPIEVQVTPQQLVSAEPIIEDAAVATHYDFYVRRMDNRALFVAEQDDPNFAGYKPETPPHISTGLDEYSMQLADSYYCGKTQEGWYHFRIPVQHFASDAFLETGKIYVNSRNSANDNPSQYTMTVSDTDHVGGYYVFDMNIGEAKRQPFSDADKINIDSEKRAAAIASSTMQTASNQTNVWRIEVPVEIADKVDSVKNLSADAGKSNSTYGEYTLQCIKSTTYSKSIIVTADKPVTKESMLKDLGLDRIPSGASQNPYLDGNSDLSVVATTAAYCQRGGRYLISVEYLQSLKYIEDFEQIENNRFYMSIKSQTGVMYTANDVYIDPANNLITYGETVYKMPDNVALIYMKSGSYYVDSMVVSGRLRTDTMKSITDAGVPLVSISKGNGDKDMAMHNETVYNVSYYVFGTASPSQVSYHTTWSVPTYSPDSWKTMYISASDNNIFANYVAYVDMSLGTPYAELYTIWDRGNPDDVANDVVKESRTSFVKRFSKEPVSDTARVLMQEIYTGPVSGTTVRPFVSNEGTVFIPIEKHTGETVTELYDQVMSDYTTSHISIRSTVDQFDDEEEENLSVVHRDWYNVSGTWKPCVFGMLGTTGSTMSAYSADGIYNWASSIASTRLSSQTESIQDGECIYAPMRPVLAMFERNIRGSDLDAYARALHASTASIYLGNSRIRYGGPTSLDDYLGTATIVHADSHGVVLFINEYAFKDASLKDKDLSQVAPSWTQGQPNAISDWINWLKNAHLSDAEDIITICIIAVLNLLPRIFMFLFILLMALSMIASVKPWQTFCDRIFDPYKFITAGRMDVHTVEIKRVVLYSMIALCLFGVFQNGLILDIIAWLTRAVTGILNR